MRTFVLLLFPGSLLLSCTGKSGHWDEFQSRGLHGGIYDYMFFTTDSTGYLGGMERLYDVPTGTKTNKAVLYRTRNGGRTWQLVFHGRGEYVDKVRKANGKTYLGIQHYMEGPVIYMSEDEKNWRLLVRFSPGVLIKDFYVYPDGELLALVRQHERLALLRIADSIEMLKSFSRSCQNGRLTKDALYLTFVDRPASSFGLIRYDLDAGTEKRYFMPKINWFEDMFADNRGRIWIAAKETKKHKALLFRFNGYKLEEIPIDPYDRYDLESIQVRDSLIYIQINRRSDIGPIGVTKHLFYSLNGGKSRHKTGFPFPLYTEPACIKPGGAYLSYMGTGRFQEFFPRNLFPD
ncbi:MAG: hypothetical protein GXO24_07305 [Chlorobi bacterium]|nr:hypothetical protein [Chlorobiota bacterium]